MARKPYVSTLTCPAKGSGKFDSRMTHSLSETSAKGSGKAPPSSKKKGKGRY